jgi:hypothetical protein
MPSQERSDAAFQFMVVDFFDVAFLTRQGDKNRQE